MKTDKALARLRKAGITEIKIIADPYLISTPFLFVSYKTFDKIVNADKKRAKK